MTQFMDLPSDLLLEMLSFLQTVDVIRMEMTCQEIRKLIQAKQHVCYRLLLRETQFQIAFFPDIYASGDHLDHDADHEDEVRDFRGLCHRLAFLDHDMSSCSKGAATRQVSPRQMRVHLRGGPKIGKTVTAMRWRRKENIEEFIDNYQETVDLSMASMHVALPHEFNTTSDDTETVKLQLFDHTGNYMHAAGIGSSPFTAVSMFNAPHSTNGFAIMFDLTDMQSLLACYYWIRDMRASLSVQPFGFADREDSGEADTDRSLVPPLLLIGNKMDTYVPEIHGHILERAIQLARENYCPLLLQSASKDINCQFALHLLMGCMSRVQGVEWMSAFEDVTMPAYRNITRTLREVLGRRDQQS